MQITTSTFGTWQGQDVIKYTMENDNGVQVSVLNLAALLQAYAVPTKDGGHKNLVLSSDTVAGFMDNGLCLNKSIGRVANRIGGGHFFIDGKEYQVEQNDGNNNIHGGSHGFKDQIWDAVTDQVDDQLQVIFTKTFTEEMDTFPGTENARIVYTLHKDNSLTIDFFASSDQPTLFNPTNHTYWNISDDDTIENIKLTLNSKHHLAVDEGKIPTGEKLVNEGTPYDFATATRMGDALAQMKAQTAEGGFDDYFVVEPSNTLDHMPVAIMNDPATGREVKIYSDRNAMIMYTANGLDNDVKDLDHPAQPWLAMALEGQTLPDAINNSAFGDTVLRPGKPQHYQLQYVVKF